MVVAYFTNFAKTGDPNGVTDLGQQLPTWPQTRGSDPSRPAEDLVLRVAGEARRWASSGRVRGSPDQDDRRRPQALA